MQNDLNCDTETELKLQHRVRVSFEFWSEAIIGDGDRKRGVHAAASKKANVLF